MMAEWWEHLPSELQTWFGSKSGQTNDFKVDIQSFPAWGSA